MKIREEHALGHLGSAIGKGLLAGLAGTAAITLSQMIEMKITKREPSDAPVKVIGQVANVQPTSEESKAKVNQEVHWAYGTAWGVTRGLIALTGLKGWKAGLVHFAAIWTTEIVMLPALNAAPSPKEEDPKTIAIDAFHHAVYATAAGLAYDALDMGSRRQRKFDALVDALKHSSLLKKIKYYKKAAL
ncbi:DUF1440 domain-containing protein [Mucilaginibacter sp. RS28]|uniref:DUF1440 domain-containing protein n=1 Tax=Mucilaginibacter straminoryzae TaxID=2932774 RepID=A0A9X1X5I0_9SPHI|nr:DUF1440 domain-containing protein [Mucilaginibacter straminoryzae]MCJ8211537.1 DUF1440 domain-containing protein [Mucilaginibacter straminoryzae]